MTLKTLDLFSGIGGFALGFQQAGGYEMAAYCELDAKAAGCFGYHWPGVPNLRNVKEVTRDAVDALGLGRIDVITGGFPCQDLSVAGQRAGLAGERSGLWFEYHRIIDGLKPQWVVIENVPGLLSSNGGADFAIVLRGLVECGYGVAWRVLDAQYAGIPQRRRRVFIVGSFGNGRAAQVLFERDGLRWNPPARAEAGQGLATDTGNGARIAGAVSSKWAKGTGGPAGDEAYNLVTSGVASVAPTLQKESYSPTKTSTGQALDWCVMQAFNNRLGAGSEVTETVRANSHGSVPMIAPTLSTKNEVASSSTQRDAWYAQSAAMIGAVRRLTPTECERLQGFPDGWTERGIDGPQSDSARYRQLGNAVAVPVARWIAERIQLVEGNGG